MLRPDAHEGFGGYSLHALSEHLLPESPAFENGLGREVVLLLKKKME